ncbi:MAG: pantoate--beta-alanine ligase [Proteobacteria bacterium]|nr:pantoate--beta-alanine ligase [Pseudomonadota bacterium]
MKPVLVRSVAELRKITGEWRRKDEKSAVVPTMGALHEGHLTLVREGFRRADRVVATIFVNPKQFAANEDFGRYPRDEDSDVAMLASEKVNAVFIPSPAEMYGPHFATTVSLAGPAKAGLEDKYRPQFFDGVTTVVAKLFLQTGADFAMFGEKDYQQLMTVTAMARDLDIPITVIGVPTVREEDGLAKSSRNRYLSKHERSQAVAIYKTLTQAAEKIRNGTDHQVATTAAVRSLTTLGFKVDYVTARNAETLAVPKTASEPLRLIAAAWIGKTRLIDNIAV